VILQLKQENANKSLKVDNLLDGLDSFIWRYIEIWILPKANYSRIKYPEAQQNQGSFCLLE